MKLVIIIIIGILCDFLLFQDTNKFLTGKPIHIMKAEEKIKGKYEGLVNSFHPFDSDSSYKLNSKKNIKLTKIIKFDSIYFEDGNLCTVYKKSSDGINTHVTNYHQNKQIESTGWLKKGKENGRWIAYYDNGQIESVLNFIDGVETGKGLYFHTNGRLKSTGQYYSGLKTGSWIICDSLGLIVETGKFKPIKIIRKEPTSIAVDPEGLYTLCCDTMVWVELGVKHGLWITLDNLNRKIYKQRFFNGNLK